MQGIMMVTDPVFLVTNFSYNFLLKFEGVSYYTQKERHVD